MAPSTSEAKGSPVSSCKGRASMSARSSIVGPGRAPSSVATTDVVLLPVRTSSPSGASASSTTCWVRGSVRPISGWRWMRRRISIVSSSSPRASSSREVCKVAMAPEGTTAEYGRISRMRLGYFAMPLHPPGADPAQTLDDDLDQLATLDRLGYEEAWIGEHFTAQWENIPCPDLFIARALGVTRRMKLATGVSCLPNHDPLMLAQRIAQLDQMARGRFYWGVGSGGFPGDFELFEVDGKSGQQRGITREVLDTVIELWNDPKPGVYASTTKHWRFRIPEPQDDIGLRLHLRPYQKPHPPIGVAGVSSELGDAGAGGRARLHPDEHQLRAAPDLEDALGGRGHGRRAGRDARPTAPPGASRATCTSPTPTPRRGARRSAGTLARDYRDYFLRLLPKLRGFDMLKVDPAMPDSEVTLEYLLDNIWIVGSPETVARKIAALGEAVGGFGTLLVIAHEWQPRAAWEHSMTLLSTEVLPRLEARR